jgi:hypothetical protein
VKGGGEVPLAVSLDSPGVTGLFPLSCLSLLTPTCEARGRQAILESGLGGIPAFEQWGQLTQGAAHCSWHKAATLRHLNMTGITSLLPSR